MLRYVSMLPGDALIVDHMSRSTEMKREFFNIEVKGSYSVVQEPVTKSSSTRCIIP